MGVYDYLTAYTAPALLRSALGKVTANVDKREGSVIFDTLSPLSVIAAGVISMFHRALSNTDLQTAQGEWLDLVASQPPCGLYRKQAIAAQKTAIAQPSNINLAVGSEYRSNGGLGLVWAITEDIGSGRYVLTCNTKGASPGGDYGELTPSEPNEELRHLAFEDVAPIVDGSDVETDNDFRLRVWAALKSNAYGGNFEDYRNWCLSDFGMSPDGAQLDGMLFFPSSRYLGGGNILICPTAVGEDDHGFMPASALVCSRLKAFLDPEYGEQMGAGVAPVGHKLTVMPPKTREMCRRIHAHARIHTICPDIRII